MAKKPDGIMTKNFNDNAKGAIDALLAMTDGKYVGKTAKADPKVAGVWEVIGDAPKFKGGKPHKFRAIVYLAGYKESDGELRKFNDFEEDDIVNEKAYQSDLNPNAKIVVTGVKGMKSASFKKTFKNMDAYDKWLDSEEAGNFEVQYVTNESLSLRQSMKMFTEQYIHLIKK